MESTEIFGSKLCLFISSDSCHKKMLLESLNIPLKEVQFLIKLDTINKLNSSDYEIIQMLHEIG